jgi:anti-anti-sigma regulatory factor
MHSLRLEKKDEVSNLFLKGEITIESAEKLRKELLEIFADGGRFVIDLSEVTQVDMSFFQLMCASKKMLSNNMGALSYSENLPESILREAQGIGFEHFTTDERFRG